MAQTTAGHTTPAGPEHAPQAFIWRYVFSKDHKVIGIQYYLTAMVMAWVAGLLAMLIRLQLAWPEKTWPGLGRFLSAGFSDGVMNPEFYAMLFSMHGTIMVFFVLSSAPVSGFGNILIPLQCGARDMAFPFLNALSYWTFLPGCLVILSSFFIGAGFFPKVFGEGGAAAGGWTSYPPLSALRGAIPGSQMGQTFWIVGMVFFIASFTMGGLNFLTTILNLRTKGLSLFRLPLTIWSMLLVAILGLLAFPALTGASLMLLLDRHFGTSFFLPTGLVLNNVPMVGANGQFVHQGGSPLLWQHLFWFLGHPEVYVLLLPALGVTMDILPVFTRRPLFGYRSTIYSLYVIAGLSMIVWGHHMYVSGMSPYVGEFFAIGTMAITIPSTIIGVNMLASLWGGSIRLTTPMF